MINDVLHTLVNLLFDNTISVNVYLMYMYT